MCCDIYIFVVFDHLIWETVCGATHKVNEKISSATLWKREKNVANQTMRKTKKKNATSRCGARINAKMNYQLFDWGEKKWNRKLWNTVSGISDLHVQSHFKCLFIFSLTRQQCFVAIHKSKANTHTHKNKPAKQKYIY